VTASEAARARAEGPSLRNLLLTFALLSLGGTAEAQFVDPTSSAYARCKLALEKGDTAQSADVACADPDWSLRQMRIHEAQALIRRVRQQEPGEGIFVGQIDTGYTMHPSIKYRLALGDSMNVLKPQDTALDTFSKGFVGAITFGKLLNPANRDPGHGTKTASILVGDPRATSKPATTGWVSGVAPAVKLIPVRGSKGPALGPIGQVQAARAICYLAGGVVRSESEGFCTDQGPAEEAGFAIPPLGHPVDVITISRAAPVEGPLPNSDRLQNALAYARSKGVVIVAASGDYESVTAYPAEACAVVSVGATIVTGSPWKPGSPHARPDSQGRLDACDQQRGLKIDVSAPGAGVWRAETARRPGQQHEDDPYRYGVGKGTSFGTPAVAGIAAMWLQYHPEIRAKYAPELVPYVFSYVVREHGARAASDICEDAVNAQGSWQYTPRMLEVFCMEKNTRWDTDYGAGIVDALGVLEAALPDVEVVCSDIRRRGGNSLDACRVPEERRISPGPGRNPR
jgi:hypothetical protein